MNIQTSEFIRLVNRLQSILVKRVPVYQSTQTEIRLAENGQQTEINTHEFGMSPRSCLFVNIGVDCSLIDKKLMNENKPDDDRKIIHSKSKSESNSEGNLISKRINFFKKKDTISNKYKKDYLASLSSLDNIKVKPSIKFSKRVKSKNKVNKSKLTYQNIESITLRSFD